MRNERLVTRGGQARQAARSARGGVANLLTRKQTHFVLWRPREAIPPPRLVVGKAVAGAPARFEQLADVALAPSPEAPELWEIPATALRLPDGVYHYWFVVKNGNAYDPRAFVLHCTDPHAFVVDWRVLRDGAPAGVIGLKGGKLFLCDSDGAAPAIAERVAADALPGNAALVLYEIPTAWTRGRMPVTADSVGVGTYRDVQALVDGSAGGGTFAPPPRHLLQLGVNAIQLLPIADSRKDRSEWGYGTCNYLAPDFDLSFDPAAPDAPARPARDLSALVEACHANGIRVFLDVVMAFSDGDPYRTANYLDFHVKWNADPPDPEQAGRDGFGGDLFKYAWETTGWDPATGAGAKIYPARQHMKCAIAHWVTQYHVDGVRLDSITNVKNFDFMREFRDAARAAWRAARRATREDRFLVLGESLPVDKAYLDVGDALWNEEFKQILRRVVVGRNWDQEPSFEWSVRKLIEPVHLGYRGLATAINYLGSHDVQGEGNERLHDYLEFCGVADKLRRFKLAFACLLTSVGIPMILAGDEFADQHDIKIWELSEEQRRERKQMDPVNYDRRDDPWRRELFEHVAHLVRLRTSEPALQVEDTNFIHVDFDGGKRVLAWTRGRAGVDRPVVVVANFSSWGSDVSAPGAEYVVPNWPAPGGASDWVEVTQGREVPAAWVGREPIYPWEAKVYRPK